MIDKSKILILGGDSKIGSYLKKYMGNKFQVVTTTRRKNLVSENCIYLDLNDPENFKKYKFTGFKAAIFCAAITNQKFCEDNFDLAKNLNVFSTINLLNFLIEQDIFIIFPSTSLIFDGKKPFCPALEKANPKGTYAKLKAEVENEIKLNYKSNFAIIRFSKIIDPNFLLFKSWIKDFHEKKKIEAFGDYFFSPIYISHCAEILEKVSQNKLNGIFNFSAKDQISYFEALKFFSNKMVGSSKNIEKISAKLEMKSLYLPNFTTLENSLKSLIDSPSTKEVLDKFLEDNKYISLK